MDDENPEEYFLGDKNDNHENAEHPMHGVVFSGFALGSEKLSGKDSFGKEVHKFLGDNDITSYAWSGFPWPWV